MGVAPERLPDEPMRQLGPVLTNRGSLKDRRDSNRRAGWIDRLLKQIANRHACPRGSTSGGLDETGATGRESVITPA